jgi:hypothetical protein
LLHPAVKPQGVTNYEDSKGGYSFGRSAGRKPCGIEIHLKNKSIYACVYNQKQQTDFFNILLRPEKIGVEMPIFLYAFK